MNRKFILFGAFLSTFILLLVPNIGCVNSIVPKDEISNSKNIRIYDLKKTENILNSDCGCQKTTNYNNNESWSPYFLCKILNVIFDKIFLLAINASYHNKIITRILVIILEIMVGLAIIFNCDWHPNFP